MEKEAIRNNNLYEITLVANKLMRTDEREVPIMLSGIKHLYPDHLFFLQQDLDQEHNRYSIKIIAKDPSDNEVTLGGRSLVFDQDPENTSKELQNLAKQKEVVIISSGVGVSQEELEGLGLGSALIGLSDNMINIALNKLSLQNKKFIFAYIVDTAKNANRSRRTNSRKGWSTTKAKAMGYTPGVSKRYLRLSTVNTLGENNFFVKIIKDDLGIFQS